MKFKKTSVLACTLAFALIIGATTAFAASSGGWHEFDFCFVYRFVLQF